MTDAHLADAIRRYRQRLARTGDPAFAAEAVPDPPEHIEVRSDGWGNLVVFRHGEVFCVRDAPGHS